MKKIFIISTIFILVSSISFLAFAFMKYDINPDHWSTSFRMAFIYFAGIANGASVLIYFVNNKKE